MKKTEENKDYIIIHKETVINYFFMSILAIAAVIFIVLLVKSVYSMSVKDNKLIDSNLVAYYNDEFLNITYPIPGGNWVMGELDTSGIEEVTKKSSGEDNYFSLDDDVLSEEVLSIICFNNEGVEGYRQFMSFSFRPSVDYSGEEFIDYCVESFKRDIENSGDYKNYELISTSMDEYEGVLLKLILTETVSVEQDDGTTKESDEELYYTQYIKKVGKNMGIVTFGSIAEDNTVDVYLKYFLNNIITEKSQLD